MTSFIIQVPKQLVIEIKRRTINFGTQYTVIAIELVTFKYMNICQRVPKQLFFKMS